MIEILPTLKQENYIIKIKKDKKSLYKFLYNLS